MAVTVLTVAFPFAGVAPDAVGGAEQIASMLDEALVERGHRSIVVACRGSRVAGELVPLPGEEPERVDRRAWCAHHEACRARLRAVADRGDVDVVHAHGVDFDGYLDEMLAVGAPVVVTLHLPVSWYAPAALERARRAGVTLVFVSASQRASVPDVDGVVISNGVRLDRFRFGAGADGYAAALGRISPEKGFHLALDAAREAGIPMRLAGKVFRHPEHVAYFDREIRPRLDDERRWIGAVDTARRRELLARARCLVVPSLAPETSSLAAMEALSSGTPVVATRAGALPDIVEHGQSGILVDDPRDLTAAIAQTAAIDRTACRRRAEARYDADVMSATYVALYERLARAAGRRSA